MKTALVATVSDAVEWLEEEFDRISDSTVGYPMVSIKYDLPEDVGLVEWTIDASYWIELGLPHFRGSM